jgi:hypothetical protein
MADEYNSIAAEETGALQNVGMMCDVAQDGGEGDFTEAPVLFSDGKGTLCIVYIAYTPSGSSNPSSAVWSQCSTNLGKSFSAPVVASPTYPYAGVHLGHARGAFGPKGEIAVTWHGFSAETVGGVNVVGVAISNDGGKTFKNVDAPAFQTTDGGGDTAAGIGSIAYDGNDVLWLAYEVNDGINASVAIDKTCDGGMTWSGSLQLVGSDGTAPPLNDPELLANAGAVSLYARVDDPVDANGSDMVRIVVAP